MSKWSRFTSWLSGWPEPKELEWFEETEEEKAYLSETGPSKDEKEE